MCWWQVMVLAVLQGLTEFLRISSSGHLALATRVFFADDAGASFTAVTQLGTEIAAIAWLLRFLVRHTMYWFVGCRVILGVLVMVPLGTRTVAAA
jgi:undecaprenyl-diphosphatase